MIYPDCSAKIENPLTAWINTLLLSCFLPAA